MRTRLLIGTAALLLCSRVATAQAPAKPPPQAPASPAAIVPSLGAIDFGFRGTETDLDGARYERYRDLRSGAASRFLFGKETEKYFFDASATNVGYRDQRYVLDYDRSKIDFNFLWDSIPTNFSYLTVSPWAVGDDGVLTISPSLRQQVQNRTAYGVPCAPGAVPPANCNTPANAALALTNRSIYNTDLLGFELQSRRDTASFGLTYEATANLDVNFNFATIGKTGHQPWGASFAFNNANELPLPLDNRTNDFSAGVEWANQKGMVRLGWDASYFDNRIQSLTWDNPIRATDFNNGLAPPNGPYDPSGYTNGNGPAQGRMSLPPSNNMHVVSAMGLYKMPRRTTVSGTLQFTNQSQNEALIPWTINPLIANPAVYAVFPGLTTLPRSTAEAEVQGVNALITLNSRAVRGVAFNVHGTAITTATTRHPSSTRRNTSASMPSPKTPGARHTSSIRRAGRSMRRQRSVCIAGAPCARATAMTGGSVTAGDSATWGTTSSAFRTTCSRISTSRFARRTKDPNDEAMGSSSPVSITRVWAARNRGFVTTMRPIAIDTGPR